MRSPEAAAPSFCCSLSTCLRREKAVFGRRAGGGRARSGSRREPDEQEGWERERHDQFKCFKGALREHGARPCLLGARATARKRAAAAGGKEERPFRSRAVGKRQARLNAPGEGHDLGLDGRLLRRHGGQMD